MAEVLRRFVVLHAFLLWQGGFVVYGGVVVPVGTEVLGSDTRQGFVTQQVTNWLNGFGLLWCAALAWDCLMVRGDAVRGWLVAACAGLLVVLVTTHPLMDSLLDADGESVLDRGRFRRLHQLYLGVSTLHWLLALVVAWRTIVAWRRHDRQSTSPPGPLSDAERGRQTRSAGDLNPLAPLSASERGRG